MKTRARIPFIALLVIVGCSGKPTELHEARENEPHAEEQGHDEAREANVLRIDAGMLRDLRITTAQVELRPAGLAETMLGELQVNENAYAEVGTPIAGRVVKILASIGQAVAAGAVLAEIQSVELGKAWSEYVSAVAEVELARRTLERKRKLAEERIVAAKDVLKADADAKAAEARLRSSRAVLNALGLHDAKISGSTDTSTFALRAPVAGTIIERSAVIGKFVEPAQMLFRVADLSRLWLAVHAFERDAVRVRIGAPVSVTFAALPGRSFSGTTILVGKQVEPASRTVAVRIEVANDDGILRPGMSANAWVPLGDETQQVVTIPAVSLQRLRDRWVAFVPRREGVFEIRRIGRGRDLGNEVEVVSGIDPGETIVVAGSFLLKAEAERARGETEEHEH
jgi:membrane fusion protein, heavy metal efflux system